MGYRLTVRYSRCQVKGGSPPAMGAALTLEALFPGVRRMVLRAFFGEPDRWWSLPELAGKAGVEQETLRAVPGAIGQRGTDSRKVSQRPRVRVSARSALSGLR